MILCLPKTLSRMTRAPDFYICRPQTSKLPILRDRMIDFENSKRPAPRRLAVRESIEAGAKDQILFDPAWRGLGQAILRISAPQYKSRSELFRKGMVEHRG
jgi:hypothetical protein